MSIEYRRDEGMENEKNESRERKEDEMEGEMDECIRRGRRGRDRERLESSLREGMHNT